MHSLNPLTQFLTTFLILLLPNLTLSSPAPAEITQGPQGYASFVSVPSFKTLKPCAQGCLKYNGLYVCGMSGWGDLGSNIGCGCSPQNYCFCDKREASKVTSYIQSCVNTKCATPSEESAVLDLYNGYCLTANIEVATTTSKPYSFTGSLSTPTNPTSPTSTVPGSVATANAAGATSTPTDTAANANASASTTPKKSGPLGIGAIIGIAVAGVVLLGALLCVGCCMFWRKRSKKNKAKKLAATNAYTAQQPIENAYVPGKEGAAQIDGTGVFGVAKPKVEEKVKPYTVSPLQTPTQTHAVPIQNQNTNTPLTPPIPSPSPNHHEMYAHGQSQQTPIYGTQPNPNHHEMYAGQAQSPSQTPQEMYTHSNNPGNGYQTQHQQQGNWLAAQLPADSPQGQYNQYSQQNSPAQLSAGRDGYVGGNGRQQSQIYEKP